MKFFGKNCKHELIFKESIHNYSKWYCRLCFTEIKDMGFFCGYSDKEVSK